MELKRIDISDSPLDSSRIRLSGEVSYQDGYETELYWFEVEKRYKDYLSNTGNLWLVSLFPLAATLGETLSIPYPVDPVLVENIEKLNVIWKLWYPNLHNVNLKVVKETKEIQRMQNCAAFFSGGVDSFFTVLRHQDQDNNIINELLLVHGFDIPIENKESFDILRTDLSKAALSLGKNLIYVVTNLRKTRFGKTSWGYLSHGCALAGIVYLLENRFNKVLIGSTGGYTDLQPWGSHPVTDPLLSSFNLQIIHDGAEFNRLQKTRFISLSEIAQNYLHVCWNLETNENCSRCSKCYRTMMTLDILGILDRFKTFAIEEYKINKIRNVFQEHGYDQIYMNHIKLAAEQQGRLDIVKEINMSLKRSARLKKLHSLFEAISAWLKQKRFGFKMIFLKRILRRIIYSNSI